MNINKQSFIMFRRTVAAILVLICLLIPYFDISTVYADNSLLTVSGQNVPAYSGETFYVLNDNIPVFDDSSEKAECFISFSELDALGRCGAAFACLGAELLPTEERENIGMIKPSGWHTVKYDDLIEDKYLYNRCHLIAYMLCGENANPLNLITGTRFFNIDGMLPYESEVHNYIVKTGNHVMYRVTPVFGGNNLLSYGIQLEAKSVEDDDISINVFIYNVQPNIRIDYSDGSSSPTVAETEELTKTLYLKYGFTRTDSVNIGKEWSYQYKVNGEAAKQGDYTLTVGDTLKLEAEFTEADKKPDVGSASAVHKITEDNLKNGFIVEMNLTVTENGGKNSGESAQFIVSFEFSVK